MLAHRMGLPFVAGLPKIAEQRSFRRGIKAPN
jgi:hypothetical protein